MNQLIHTTSPKLVLHQLGWGILHAMWRNHAYAFYLNSITNGNGNTKFSLAWTSGLKSWDTENLIQAIKAVCNKEMGYLAAAKYITCLVLHYTITFAQIGTLFKPPSPNWDVSQLFLQLLKRILLNIFY